MPQSDWDIISPNFIYPGEINKSLLLCNASYGVHDLGGHKLHPVKQRPW